MSFSKVKKIMDEAVAGFLATTDGKRAAVRPMGGGIWVGREFWYATAADSAKVAQIKKKPSVELCYADKKWRHVRISGKCRVSAAAADKKKMYNAVPVLKAYFKGPADPALAVLRIKAEKVRLMDLADMEYTEVALP